MMIDSRKGKKDEEIATTFASTLFQQPGIYGMSDNNEMGVSGSGVDEFLSWKRTFFFNVRKSRAPNFPAPRLRRQAAFAGGGRGGLANPRPNFSITLLVAR